MKIQKLRTPELNQSSSYVGKEAANNHGIIICSSATRDNLQTGPPLPLTHAHKVISTFNWQQTD